MVVLQCDYEITFAFIKLSSIVHIKPKELVCSDWYIKKKLLFGALYKLPSLLTFWRIDHKDFHIFICKDKRKNYFNITHPVL
jgi:hypothetical protein